MRPPHFVLAILLVNGRYALQLRDDRPEIHAPGVWALFGGSRESGEPPARAIAREIEEELGIRPDPFRLLWEMDNFTPLAGAVGHYWVFEADATSLWSQHRLTEGQDAQHFAWEQLPAVTMPPLIREIIERHHSPK